MLRSRTSSLEPTAWRWIAFRVVAILLGMALAGGLLEVALAIGGYDHNYFNPLNSFHQGHPLVGYLGKPNFVGRFRRPEFDTVIAHNAEGFRLQENAKPRSRCRHRIFAFGDSFTWGWGVTQGEVFTDQMNRMLPDHCVENFGLSASGTVQQFRLFEEYVEKDLAPGDTVIVMFFNNDFDDNLNGRLRAVVEGGQVKTVGPLSQIASGVGDSIREYLKNHSDLFNALFYAGDYLIGGIKQGQTRVISPEQLGLGDDSSEMIVAEHFLAAFRDRCQRKRAHFVAALIPGQEELGEAALHDEGELNFERDRRRMFFRCAREAGIDTVDLLPFFNSAKDGTSERYTHPHDSHWNAKGHLAAAQALSRYVLSRGDSSST